MMDTSDRLLLRRALLILSIAFVAVVICYFWIDRPVAFFVYHHQFNRISVFRWLTYPPPIVQSWSPAIITAMIVSQIWAPLRGCRKTLLVACLNLIVADQFRTSLGDVCGRYWPETWFDNNPSLIGTGTYGFHPFVHGDDIGSFPSGHACRIVGFASVWWLAVPRSRVWLILICPPMLLSLIAMDYHFVGDVIAGSALGAVLGMFTVHMSGLRVGDVDSAEQPDTSR